MSTPTVASLLRSSQALCGQVSEKETLNHGICYYSRRFAPLPEANQFREVLIEDAADVPRAFEQTERWYQERGLVCWRWAPADGTASDALRDFLGGAGFRERRYTALRLTHWPTFSPSPSIRVLPARAMRPAYQDTFLRSDEPAAPEVRGCRTHAWLERLDDPPFDMFVALDNREPVGRCGLYQVGDIARVIDLHVLSAFAMRGVEESLLHHVLGLSRRLAMRTTCVQLCEEDRAALQLFTCAGFTPDGSIVEFERSVPPVDRPPP